MGEEEVLGVVPNPDHCEVHNAMSGTYRYGVPDANLHPRGCVLVEHYLVICRGESP